MANVISNQHHRCRELNSRRMGLRTIPAQYRGPHRYSQANDGRVKDARQDFPGTWWWPISPANVLRIEQRQIVRAYEVATRSFAALILTCKDSYQLAY
jgi:hypothetical protein